MWSSPTVYSDFDSHNFYFVFLQLRQNTPVAMNEHQTSGTTTTLQKEKEKKEVLTEQEKLNSKKLVSSEVKGKGELCNTPGIL